MVQIVMLTRWMARWQERKREDRARDFSASPQPQSVFFFQRTQSTSSAVSLSLSSPHFPLYFPLLLTAILQLQSLGFLSSFLPACLYLFSLPLATNSTFTAFLRSCASLQTDRQSNSCAWDFILDQAEWTEFQIGNSNKNCWTKKNQHFDG